MLKKRTGNAVVEFSHVGVKIQNKQILSELSFRIERGERWAIVGPNGSGKTTLLRIVNGYARPQSGKVSVLADTFGEQTDLNEVRKKAGFVSSYLDNLVESKDNAMDVVISGKYGATRLWEVPPYEDVQRARRLMRQLGCGRFEDRNLDELSEGERQKILIARSLMPDPALLTLDEPCASLDLSAREIFLRGIETIARRNRSLAILYVTHRIDEIPSCFTHALLLKNGKAIASGRINRVITSGNLSASFGIDLTVRRWRNRLYPVVPD